MPGLKIRPGIFFQCSKRANLRDAAARFVVQYDADVTDKNSKKRFQLSEVGVYTVKNGKIVREEFLPRSGS